MSAQSPFLRAPTLIWIGAEGLTSLGSVPMRKRPSGEAVKEPVIDFGPSGFRIQWVWRVRASVGRL